MKRQAAIMDFFAKYGIVVVLIALVVFFSIISPQFLKMNNIFNILRQVAIVGIASVGMTMVLLTGGIDLTAGSVIGVGSVLTAALILAGMPTVPAVIVVLLISAGIGMINGFFINAMNIPPLITTLGLMTSLRGVAYLITGGLPIFGFKSGITALGKGYFLGIPLPVVLMAGVFLVGILFLEKTRYGRYIYGVGGNEEASILSGINVKQVRYIVYSISGMLCGLAGIVLLARINSGQPNAGTGYEMDIITAVVLGGVSISGGEGRLPLVVIGVLIMGVLTNGMILMNIQEYVQWVVKGLVLVAAVGFDRFTETRKAQLA